MTFLQARSQYLRAASNDVVVNDNPHEIILVTLRELERSMRVLVAAQAAGTPAPDSHLNRAFTAIYILQSSLDFEVGGEIATNLFRVYEYCRQQVVKVFQKQPAPELLQAVEHIASIVAAWQDIGAKPASRAANF